jgi:hypothetical protein
MNHQNQTLTFYLGQGTDSQARIISRQIHKSPRTWIASIRSSVDPWRYLTIEGWEGQPSSVMVKKFSPRLIYPEGFGHPWLDSWACDHLLIDELEVRDVMDQGILEAFASLAMKRCMNIHVALMIEDEKEQEAFEDFVGQFVRRSDVIRFWIPNQDLDLRYLRLPVKSWIDLPRTDSAEMALSSLLCLLHQRPRSLGQKS